MGKEHWVGEDMLFFFFFACVNTQFRSGE